MSRTHGAGADRAARQRASSLRSQLVLHGPHGGLRPGRHAELGKDVCHMAVRCPCADDQLIRDLTIDVAARNQSDHLSLALTQQIWGRCPRLRHIVEAGQDLLRCKNLRSRGGQFDCQG